LFFKELIDPDLRFGVQIDLCLDLEINFIDGLHAAAIFDGCSQGGRRQNSGKAS
jgi:hypothetical protein